MRKHCSSPTMWRGQGRNLQRSKVVLIREAIWVMETLDKLRGKAGVGGGEEHFLVAVQGWRREGVRGRKIQPAGSERCNNKLMGAVSEGT